VKLKKLIILTASAAGMVGLVAAGNAIYKSKDHIIADFIVEKALAPNHYSPPEINDEFSAKVFDIYIKDLDYGKMYFNKGNIEVLKTYKNKIDDAIKGGNSTFFELSLELLQEQLDKSKLFYNQILDKPFDYDKMESFQLDEEKRDFSASEKERRDLWRKSLKAQTIAKIYELDKQQKSDKEKNDTVTLKSFKDLELIARSKVRKRYDQRFKRIEQLKRQDRYSAFINAITAVYDPHTNYFPPKDKENFDISISGKLEGIGATLQEKEGYIKVISIVPGSASWRQGDLKAGDVILKVGQDKEEPVDIVDMRLDDAVRLIRGPKGTKVVLTVKTIDGDTKRIPIVRDIVEIEASYAKSTIITDTEKKHKVGYIYLPKFYVDFHNRNGRRCAVDVRNEIQKLKKENVEGIIFDLRNNGGGSLQDVRTIGGYFIEEGPIVQVRGRNNNVRVLADYDKSVLYDGPLIVMVNSFSASASEILAAAMQDYDRAIIVGTPHTYGKGTVQNFDNLDSYISRNDADAISMMPLGHVKVTIQKFYRINGGATQLKGVSSDIVLPDKYQFIDIGEKELKNPMPWDEIKPAAYEKVKSKFNIEKLKKNSSKRILKDSSFVLTLGAANWLKEQRDQTEINLNYQEYEFKEIEDEAKNKEYSRLGKIKTEMEIIPVDKLDKPVSRLDSVKTQKVEDWHKSLKLDYQLNETMKIMYDVID